MLQKITFERFTAFAKLTIPFSPGINIFIGENGTGKTHVMKAAYAACAVAHPNGNFAEKITRVFYPSGLLLRRLVKRTPGSSQGSVVVTRTLPVIQTSPPTENLTENLASIRLDIHATRSATLDTQIVRWTESPITPVYIPVKDMLANSRGFLSLYNTREIQFEETYADIVTLALLPLLKGQPDAIRGKILETLREAINGRVETKNDEFFLHYKEKKGNLEFTLLAEGFRKLGLLWTLIQNGTLQNGSVLFWDEPETNLNPKMLRIVVEILLSLQQSGVQIFLATHDYALLKEFDLQAEEEHLVWYHSLYHDKDNNDEIAHSYTAHYRDIAPNAIGDTFGDLLSREIDRAMGGAGK